MLWPPRRRQDNSVAELTEMRITGNNAAAPQIMQIRASHRKRQLSQQSAGPQTDPGPMTRYNGPRGAPGALRACSPPRGPGFWPPHACRLHGGLFVSISLAGMEAAASQGLVWLPLLPGKGSSQLPTQLPLFLTSPLLNVAIKCLPLRPVPR